MKILGISTGTKNGNNDTMCRVALEAARDAGAEIEFIHLFDWNIKYCTGCVACSTGLVMGKGMVCSQKDDFPELYEKLVEADGVLCVDPIFESGATGLFHTITDRLGPGHDTGLMYDASKQMEAKTGKGLDKKYFKQKAISFVGIGGSDWAVRVETDHAMFAMSPGWKVVNNEFFSWSKDVIMQDEKIERMKEIGRNLVEAAAEIAKDNESLEFPVRDNTKSYWKGKPGVCPHCQGNNFYIYPDTGLVVCELCGLEGTLEMTDGKYKFIFDPKEEHRAHDTISGKELHGEDIFKNEAGMRDLKKDEEFKLRKAYYTAVIEPTKPTRE